LRGDVRPTLALAYAAVFARPFLLANADTDLLYRVAFMPDNASSNVMSVCSVGRLYFVLFSQVNSCVLTLSLPSAVEMSSGVTELFKVPDCGRPYAVHNALATDP